MRSRFHFAVVCAVFLGVFSISVQALNPPTFESVSVNIPHLAGRVAVADFDGNGVLDLAVSGGEGAQTDPNVIQVFLRDNVGAATLSSTLNVDAAFAPIRTGDFNNDGKLDMVSWGTSNFSVYLGDGTGGFSENHTSFAAVPYPPLNIEVSDFNNDNVLDLAVAFPANGLQIMLGVGDGTFETGDRPFNGIILYKPCT